VVGAEQFSEASTACYGAAGLSLQSHEHSRAVNIFKLVVLADAQDLVGPEHSPEANTARCGSGCLTLHPLAPSGCALCATGLLSSFDSLLS
jgi:hypothetical protein